MVTLQENIPKTQTKVEWLTLKTTLFRKRL